MLLENRNALLYVAGGKIGAAVARAFAREGANVFLAGRALTTLTMPYDGAWPEERVEVFKRWLDSGKAA